jgi:hypothetical protein
MAITPNVSVEQGNKLAVRANTRGGVTPVFQVIDPAVAVNSFATTSGVLRLTVSDATSTFTISGTGTGVKTSTISASSAKVNDLITALVGSGSGPLASSTFFVNAGGSVYLKNTTVDIIVPSGIVLSVVSGTGTTPTLGNIVFSGSNAEAVTYPSYVGTPNATPTWVDDATVHAYPVIGIGAVVQDTTKTVQAQVRQISTQVSETQQYDGYFATYSGNLFQTAQKRTWRQQS